MSKPVDKKDLIPSLQSLREKWVKIKKLPPSAFSSITVEMLSAKSCPIESCASCEMHQRGYSCSWEGDGARESIINKDYMKFIYFISNFYQRIRIRIKDLQKS